MSSANNDCFTSFQFGCLLFLLLVWLLWLGLPVLCWIRMGKADIPVSFLILREMLVVFVHWVWHWLQVCHIWPLLHWGFPLFPLFWEFFIINKCWTLWILEWASKLGFSFSFNSHLKTFLYCFWRDGREKGNHQCKREAPIGCLLYAPGPGIVHAQTKDLIHNLGTWHDWESNLQPFGFGTTPHPTEPHQPEWFFISLVNYFNN